MSNENPSLPEKTSESGNGAAFPVVGVGLPRAGWRRCSDRSANYREEPIENGNSPMALNAADSVIRPVAQWTARGLSAIAFFFGALGPAPEPKAVQQSINDLP